MITYCTGSEKSRLLPPRHRFFSSSTVAYKTTVNSRATSLLTPLKLNWFEMSCEGNLMAEWLFGNMYSAVIKYWGRGTV